MHTSDRSPDGGVAETEFRSGEVSPVCEVIVQRVKDGVYIAKGSGGFEQSRHRGERDL